MGHLRLQSKHQSLTLVPPSVLTLPPTLTQLSLKGGHPHFIHTQGVCINGTIYRKNKPYNYGPFGIAAFDVGDKRYQMIQLPFPHEADMMTDHMALVDYEHLVKGNIITMWVLQINHQDKANTCFLMKPMLVFTVHTGEIVLIPSVLSKNFGVFYYDMENKSLREVKVSRLPDYGMTLSSSTFCPICDRNSGKCFVMEGYKLIDLC
ncbi:hypothetical protein AAG906_031612 [Vitis piasezkii]